ncbi:MAG: chorismate synthase, partial [Clostridiales bacterium]
AAADVALLAERNFPTLDIQAGERMIAEIEQARQQKDSLGGLIELAAVGLPPGLGEPLFGGVENRLSAALFAIPAVRGVEFGEGFAAAASRGSLQNDAYYYAPDGRVLTATNHHGGVLAGMTTGMPLLLRVAVKPTPSIGQEQQTVDLRSGENVTLRIVGRHDPCIVPRAVPVVEAVASLVLLDLLLSGV